MGSLPIFLRKDGNTMHGARLCGCGIALPPMASHILYSGKIRNKLRLFSDILKMDLSKASKRVIIHINYDWIGVPMVLLKDETLKDCGVGENTRVLAAVSGGADSVALLTELARLADLKRFAFLAAAHINHGIRGAEADRDERFTVELCQKLSVPCKVIRVDAPAYAKAAGRSTEWAARTLRYEALRQAKSDLGCGCIALAHHMDDNAETLLMNLVRGCGTRGLCGMRPESGDLARPLLNVTKAEILGFLADIGQEYVTDSTNLDEDCRRNHVRLSVVPALAEMNPAIVSNLSKTAALLRTDDDYLCELAHSEYKRLDGNRFELSKLPAPLLSRIMLDLLWESADSVENAEVERLIGLLTAQSGSFAQLKGGRTAWVDGKRLHVEQRTEPYRYELELPLGVPVRLPNGTVTAERVRSAEFPCDRQTVYINAEAVCGRLMVRTVRDGDRFMPFGMSGSKLLSDYFTDRKISRFIRRDVPIVCDDTGIAAVMGHTVDERMRVTGETPIIRIKYEEGI